MEANIKDVLVVVMQQRNDALNKVAELTAQNLVMQKKLKTPEPSEKAAEEPIKTDW
tara:strand:- start:123 stop:290 length:168 start_codon:yes stop_codon:yes gene_type:complete